MVLLIISGVWFIAQRGLSVASINFDQPVSGGFVTALFLGFGTAMPGISGIKRSANVVCFLYNSQHHSYS